MLEKVTDALRMQEAGDLAEGLGFGPGQHAVQVGREGLAVLGTIEEISRIRNIIIKNRKPGITKTVLWMAQDRQARQGRQGRRDRADRTDRTDRTYGTSRTGKIYKIYKIYKRGGGTLESSE